MLTEVRFGAVWMLLAACGGSTGPITVAPTPSGSLFSSGEAVAYSIEAADGRVIGRAHSRYAESAGKKAVVTRISLEDRTFEYATTMAEDLSPIDFKRLSSVDGRTVISFEANVLTRVTDLGTEQFPAAKGELIPRDDLVMLALVIEKAGLQPGQSARWSVRSPDLLAPQDWTVQVYADPQRRTIVQLPIGKATLNERGQIAELTAGDGRTFRRVDPPGEPPALLPMPQRQEYVRPSYASWVDKEIAIPVEGGQLGGVLSRPQLRSKWKSNVVPGVVFLSDLPRQNRHGFTGGADYGTWQIFDHLAEQGFAVLRVDDRGTGASKSSIPADGVSIEIQTADAVAMIEAMREQADVDRERIYLIGHGWGALPALAAAKAQEVRGVVLIAPPLRAAEKTIDMRALAKEVTEPVAIFQGFKDFEVSWRDDAQPLAEAFAKKQAKLFVYEFVDHLLKQESGTSSPARYADPGRKVDPAVLSDLVGWLTEKAQ